MFGDNQRTPPDEGELRMSGATNEQIPDDDDRMLRNLAVRTSSSIFILQRRAEQELQNATTLLEERSVALSVSVSVLNATLDSAPDGIIAYDLTGRIIAHNSRFSAMWGLTDADLKEFGSFDIAAQVAPLLKSPETFLERIHGSRTHPEVEVFDVFELRDGRSFERIAVPQRIDGVCVGVVAHWRDVTEARRSAETQLALAKPLRQAQKMESLGELSGGIAHDFNNILGAILGNAELALLSPSNVASVIESLTAIREAGDRATRLVQQILTFSRRQPHSRIPIAIADTVREAARLLRATIPAGIELQTDLDVDAPLIMGDATQLHQIVMNLCTNAMHALQERSAGAGRVGRIGIELKHGRTGVGIGLDAPGALLPGSFVRMQVSDNGVGMDAQTQARIFEPFFTTRQQGDGTGLGLSVVHGIMETHGGAIVVHSDLDVGTSFVLSFPSIEDQWSIARMLPLSTDAVSKDAMMSDTVRVLYVDDDQMIVSLVSRLLAKSACVVTGFACAADALDVIRTRPDDVDVVITDFNMPEHSGLDIARAVRDTRPDLPVVITSGYLTNGLQEEANRLGVHELLYKPDLAKRLLQIVRSVPRAARRAP